MATSLLANFLSFLLPSKPQHNLPQAPPLPPSSLSLPSTSRKTDPSLLSLTTHDDDRVSSELSSVICPSLAYSNTLFFRSSYNVKVVVEDNEPEKRLVGRFCREVMKAGIIQECKRRRYFENKQDEKKRKAREASKRNRKRHPGSRATLQNKWETTTKKPSEEEEDNWDLSKDDIIYY